jgi:putative endonuclease
MKAVNPAKTQNRCQTSYQAGLAGEAQARDLYCQSGGEILAQRCRTEGGEIDLIVRQPHALWGDVIVFAEVKRRKTLALAAESLQARQQARIARAAELWLAERPQWQAATCRFDAVLLDENNQSQLIENAWLA